MNGWSTLAVAHTDCALSEISSSVTSPPTNGSEANDEI